MKLLHFGSIVEKNGDAVPRYNFPCQKVYQCLSVIPLAVE
jgi:hypothetical protein